MAEDPTKTLFQQDIGDNLRRIYDGVLVTDVDDLFEVLLAKLKEKRAKD